MIKIYCDKCGKEITDHVNEVAEETEAMDLKGNVVAKWKDNIFHYCDECQYDDLTCGFKVGDKVITDDGRVGTIESICDCESCKERGFYEPRVEMEIGDSQIWITNTDKRNGFKNFYKIGDQIFGNLNKQCVIDSIEYKKAEVERNRQELDQLKVQLNIVNKLSEGDIT